MPLHAQLQQEDEDTAAKRWKLNIAVEGLDTAVRTINIAMGREKPQLATAQAVELIDV